MNEIGREDVIVDRHCPFIKRARLDNPLTHWFLGQILLKYSHAINLSLEQF